MQDIKQQIISYLAVIIKESLAIDTARLELVYPVFADQGDLSLPCFSLAQAVGLSAPTVAQRLAQAWDKLPGVTQLKAVGPYLNFYLDSNLLAQRLYNNFDQAMADTGHGAKLMLEFANGNTHKEFHIGHLRNVAYGGALVGLLSAVGYEVIPVSYVNDFGIHVAKTIWQLEHDKLDETNNVNRGFRLGQAYTEAVARLEADPQAKTEVARIMTAIESRQGSDYELWRTTREWSLEYFKFIYSQLKINFAHYYFESDLLESGKTLVRSLLAKGILTESQGAVIADLSAEDLGVLVIMRQDGTALYPVADLALAVEKFASTELAQSIIIVDKRQSLYFKQLFALLKKLGYQQPMRHLPYDVVTLPSGMMSSRLGNVVLYHDLYQRCLAKLSAETASRHHDWTQDQIEAVAQKLTVATLKFEMIKVGAEKAITFNIDEALRFDGYTAAYLQYSVARINSLLTKAGLRQYPDQFSYPDKTEQSLLVALAKYPEIVSSAATAFEPSILAQYLFDVAQLFNDFYQACPVLTAEESIKQSRLALANHCQRVLTDGLGLLGIEVVTQM